jgi:hypothetical protein
LVSASQRIRKIGAPCYKDVAVHQEDFVRFPDIHLKVSVAPAALQLYTIDLLRQDALLPFQGTLSSPLTCEFFSRTFYALGNLL